jgi:hypothetical protein
MDIVVKYLDVALNTEEDFQLLSILQAMINLDKIKVIQENLMKILGNNPNDQNTKKNPENPEKQENSEIRIKINEPSLKIFSDISNIQLKSTVIEKKKILFFQSFQALQLKKMSSSLIFLMENLLVGTKSENEFLPINQNPIALTVKKKKNLNRKYDFSTSWT